MIENQSRPNSAPGIRPQNRNLIVQGLILAVVLGHGLCILAKREFWPWSDYPMYSGITRPVATSIRVIGLTPDGEIEISAIPYLLPMNKASLSATFAHLQHVHADLERPLRSMLKLYRNNKKSGVHAGPDLVGLKLEFREWDLDRTLSNLDAPRKRQVLCEIRDQNQAPP